MAKILLVEDDNNLREIYEARLMAEGYEIVSARDGEEALSVAIKEKPDLVISDVMMPKISGFDMLDILRTTEETKNVKVIMMTALSQAEDKARAEKLGADRYLVKSQVTLEDVAKVAKEVLEGVSGAPAPQPAPIVAEPTAIPTMPAVAVAPEPAEPATPTPVVVSEPTPVPAPLAVADPAPATMPEPTTAPITLATPEPVTPVSILPTPIEQTAVSEEKAIAQQIEGIIAQSAEATSSTSIPSDQNVTDTTTTEPAVVPAPQVEPTPAPTVVPVATEVVQDKKIIEPINDLNVDMGPKLNAMMEQEEQNEAQQSPSVDMPAPTTPAPAPNDEAPVPQHMPEDKIDPNSIAL